jgi:hypothetical protein
LFIVVFVYCCIFIRIIIFNNISSKFVLIVAFLEAVQNLLHLAGSGSISPTDIADHSHIDGQEEGFLDSIIADLMDHDAFNTSEERIMIDIDDEDISDDEEASAGDDDGGDDDDEMMDDTAKDAGTSDDVAYRFAHLSVENLFENFEDSIEWGGYDYDYRHGGQS